ncbi:MAG: AMP-binding protein [Candidatus Nanopelagicales bacterium]
MPTGLSAVDAADLVTRYLGEGTRFAVPAAQPSETADVVLRSSGSSAAAKSIGHTFAAIEWAANAGLRALGAGRWRWLLLLSPVSAGGLMVLARSAWPPLVWPGIGSRFEAADVARWYPGGADATSLVSTQLARLLEVPEGVRMLASMQAVLVGGGPLSDALRERCGSLDIPVVSTYGATETLGGCVYDGRPWPGVDVRLVHDEIHLDGPNLSAGYVPGPAIDRPWPTGDLGRWRDGRLEVTGRADAQVPVKGVNRHLREYELDALARPGVVEAVAVAVPDDADGYRVVVFVEDDVQRLPRLETGKPDRQELLRRASGQRR